MNEQIKMFLEKVSKLELKPFGGNVGEVNGLHAYPVIEVSEIILEAYELLKDIAEQDTRASITIAIPEKVFDQVQIEVKRAKTKGEFPEDDWHGCGDYDLNLWSSEGKNHVTIHPVKDGFTQTQNMHYAEFVTKAEA